MRHKDLLKLSADELSVLLSKIKSREELFDTTEHWGKNAIIQTLRLIGQDIEKVRNRIWNNKTEGEE